MGKGLLENFESKLQRMLRNTETEREIKHLLYYMDLHLKLLTLAQQKNNQEVVDLQKEQLEKIRQQLTELEYFSF